MLRREVARMLNRKGVLGPIFSSYSVNHCENIPDKKGLVLGVYKGGEEGFTLTDESNTFDLAHGGLISSIARKANLDRGDSVVIHSSGGEYYGVALAGLGEKSVGFNEKENLEECKESIRIGVGSAVRALQQQNVREIFVEGFRNPEAAAEGATLAAWRFDLYRTTRCPKTKINPFNISNGRGLWDSGVIKADAQNVARCLEEMPPNRLNPQEFAKRGMEELCPCGVQVDVRYTDWLEEKGLGVLLKIGKGCSPPLMLELSYCGGAEGDKPVVLVGKGVTFDSGGLCLKKCKWMEEHKADMAGAAVVLAAVKAAAMLQIPINLTGVIPLCENMPGGMAMKPGDVMGGLSGKNIKLLDTSKEGRVILADVLSYTALYNPCLVVSVANLTEGIKTGLGGGPTGAFTSSDLVWEELSKAGAETGDRVWRMPLWKFYSDNITKELDVDVKNVGKSRLGGTPSVGAAFLLEFAPAVDYLHLDITGTGMVSSGSLSYLREGLMTGRPTRTLIQFLNQMACPHDIPKPCSP